MEWEQETYVFGISNSSFDYSYRGVAQYQVYQRRDIETKKWGQHLQCPSSSQETGQETHQNDIYMYIEAHDCKTLVLITETKTRTM